MVVSVKIRAPKPEDTEAICRIQYDAMDEFHDFYAALFVMHPSEMLPRLTRRALRRPEEIFLVAEEATSGAVVGYVRYVVTDASGEAEGAAAEQEGNGNDSTMPIKAFLESKPHMKDLHTRFKEAQEKNDDVYEKTSKGHRHNYVKHLMVDPAHQRKGIGRQLLATVTARSDAEGIPTFISSSKEANQLYLSLGFEELGTAVIDNGYWAQEIVAVERALGMHGNEGLAEAYEGKMEVERSLVRWVPSKPA